MSEIIIDSSSLEEGKVIGAVDDKYPIIYAPATMAHLGGVIYAMAGTAIFPSHPSGLEVIFVDRAFFKCSPGLRKFWILHEVAHLDAGDLYKPEVKAIGAAGLHLKKGVHPIEAAADRYAIDRCSTSELKEVLVTFRLLSAFSMLVPGFQDFRYRKRELIKEIRTRKKKGID